MPDRHRRWASRSANFRSGPGSRADQIGHAVETGHRHGSVDQRDLDLLAAPSRSRAISASRIALHADMPVAISTIGGPVRTGSHLEIRSAT